VQAGRHNLHLRAHYKYRRFLLLLPEVFDLNLLVYLPLLFVMNIILKQLSKVIITISDNVHLSTVYGVYFPGAEALLRGW